MPITLKSTGGGSVSIDVPSTGSTFTLTAPANNATIFTTDGGAITGNVAFTSNNVSIGGQTISPAVGMRNRIINGAMTIDQRNSGASVTINTYAVNYTLDRWAGIGQVTDGVFTIRQMEGANTSASNYESGSSPTGFKNSSKVTVTTADSSIGASQVYAFQQRIEGFSMMDLAWGTANAKSATLSFWVKSNQTGTFYGALADSAGSVSFIFPYTISSSNTWTYITVNVPGPTSGTFPIDNSIHSFINFSLGVGSSYKTSTTGSWVSGNYVSVTGETPIIGTLNATWYITGVQLEAGTTATPFEFRQYQQELALCQRYYQQMSFTGRGYCIGSTYSIDCCISWPAMRVTPGFSKIKNPTSTLNLYSGSLYGQPYAYTTSSGNFNVQGAASGDMYLYDVRYETTGAEL